MNLSEIVKCEKEICGIDTEYYLFRIDDKRYRICIYRENINTSAEFYCDFFDVVELFKAIVKTDTLPENLSEIACDIKNSFYV